MIKINKLFSFISSFIIALSIGACSDKLPSSNYEKVKFAFNGVEKSFKKITTTQKGLVRTNRNNRIGSNINDGLNTIFSVYTENDLRDDFLEDVSYNQPPMIQFQYIKKVLEKIGGGYDFNTKYSDSINGEVYIDIETGQKSDKEKDKFNYTLGLAIEIHIDDNDLITSDVSFDINLKRGDEEYNTKWYVGIDLDYDMTSNSPNYTMAMITENNESELPYYKHYTYEYDYVEVKDSSINEWRKFCIDTSTRLVKDNDHPNFASYEGVTYDIEPLAWYKDGKYYKADSRKSLTKDKADLVAEALFNGIGLNATEINPEAYFNKASSKNSVLTTCYKEFNKIAKEDIIYSLLAREEHSGDNDNPIITSIRAMNADLSGGADGYHIGDMQIGRIFNGFIDFYDTKTLITLYYIDQNGGLMTPVEHIDRLNYMLKETNRNVMVRVEYDDTLSDGVKALKLNGSPLDSNELTIIFRDEGNNVEGSMNFYYEGELPKDYVAPIFPSELSIYGVPSYATETASEFIYKADADYEGGKKHLTIKGSNYDEAEAYVKTLKNNGFNQSDVISTGPNEYLFIKYNSDTQVTYVIFKFDKSSTDYELTIWEAVKEPDDKTITAISLVGDFNGWAVDNGCVEFIKRDENTFVSNEIPFSEGEKFKIVANHTWEIEGGFGYNKIQNIKEYKDLFEEQGSESNVLIKQGCFVTFVCMIDGNNIIIQIMEARAF